MSILRSRFVLAFGVALGVSLATPLPLCAQTLDSEKVHKIQAAYIYNFAKFADWPVGTFADRNQPIVIGVVGTDPMFDILRRAVHGKTVGGRAVEVQGLDWSRAEDRDAARRCHMLYVCSDEPGRIADILESVASYPVLTVSEIEGFAQHGGMIGLVLSDNRIVFEINRKAVDGSKIKLSAKLLQLARIVK